MVAIVFALRVSVALALVLAIPAAGFLIRTFIVFHDCAHGSFLPTRRGNVVHRRRCSACSSGSRSTAGATSTPCTTRPPATSTGAASATSRRSPSPSTRRGAACGRLGYRALPQPARHVRARLAPRPRRQAALHRALGAPADSRQRDGHQPRARGRSPSASACALGWQAYLLVQGPVLMLTGAGRRLALLRPAPVRGHLLGSPRRVELRRRGAPRQLVPEAPHGAAVLHRQHRPAPRAPPERPDPELQPPGRARREPTGCRRCRC